jgi:hypothetical protein
MIGCAGSGGDDQKSSPSWLSRDLHAASLRRYELRAPQRIDEPRASIAMIVAATERRASSARGRDKEERPPRSGAERRITRM